MSTTTGIPWTDSTAIEPGMCFEKDGLGVVVEYVEGGEVYYRKWRKGVTQQGFLENCFRMPIARFVEQTKIAMMRSGNEGS